jgi:hypothetical protein
MESECTGGGEMMTSRVGACSVGADTQQCLGAQFYFLVSIFCAPSLHVSPCAQAAYRCVCFTHTSTHTHTNTRVYTNIHTQAAEVHAIIRHRQNGSINTALVGFREYIFSESAGALGRFAAATEYAFGTISQRTMTHPARVRLHYGHPDLFNKLYVMTKGGISKATRSLHLTEDVFCGCNHMLRGARIRCVCARVRVYVCVRACTCCMSADSSHPHTRNRKDVFLWVPHTHTHKHTHTHTHTSLCVSVRGLFTPLYL